MTAVDRKVGQPELDALDFGKLDGLVPVVAQDVDTGTVLMVAFANRDALEATLETGELHFWSRSRESLWRKGETSGHVLRVVSLHRDCDADTVLARVRPAGPACHTGDPTCFGAGTEPSRTAARGADDASAGPLADLDATLEDRARSRPEGSYTVKLLDDPNLRVKKLGEEAAELVAALATSDTDRAVEETADLLYHAFVALRAEGVSIRAVLNALEERA
jgi:phosphoribosyl-ATP pyrophosphohydrolase/phosphoribosyl-AMP cyclohydrolase